MDIVAKSKEFRKVLGKVYRGVASRPPYPALSGIHLEVENNSLKLTATDLEVGITSRCPVEVREEGSVVLPGKVLYNLVKSLSSPELEIVSLPDGNSEIRGGKSYYKLSGFPADDFPLFPLPSSITSFSVPGEKLKEGLMKVYFTASKDESSLPLSGVLFHFEEEGKLKLVASDDHVLSLCSIEVQNGEVAQYILPLRAITEIIRLAEGETRIFPAKGFILFQWEDISLFSRLIEGEYPDYKRVIPQSFVTQTSLPGDELRKALERVSLVAPPESPVVELLLGEGKIELSSSGEVGIAKEEVEAEIEGEEIKIFFNARYLLDTLRSFSGEKAMLEISGELAPTRLRGEDEHLQYILMPVEIKE